MPLAAARRSRGGPTNAASRPLVKPEVANNPTVFLSEADMKPMAAPDSLGNDLRRLMTRTFTAFKTGL